MANWAFEKDEMLIEFVQCKPGLYDPQSAHYNDNRYKKTAWSEIEQSLRMAGAKSRWQQLRAQYRKYLSKQKSKNGQPGAKITKWRFANHMAFLSAYDRSQQSSVANNESDNDNSDYIDGNSNTHFTTDNGRNIKFEVNSDSVTNLATKSRLSDRIKRGTESPDKEEERQVHPMEHFFSLMAATVKNFSPMDQHYIKTQVFTLVNQIEEKYLIQPSASYLTPNPSIQRTMVPQGSTSQTASSTTNFLENVSSHNCSSLLYNKHLAD